MNGISSPHLSPVEPATTTFRSEYSEVLCVFHHHHARQPAPQPRRSTLMAKARGRGKPVRRRDKKGGPGSGRRKPCQHCRDKIDQVDYKDIPSLKKFISEKGKIRSRRITGSCRRHQVQIARAVKRARELALLPYVNEGGRDDSPRRDRGDRDRDR
jgi:small subunit ribosomal protein S18